MGNNHISGRLPEALGNLRSLQRIVLHQNKLSGAVPRELAGLSCVVNLAGNPRLVHGPDVPQTERKALLDIFEATRGHGWACSAGD